MVETTNLSALLPFGAGFMFVGLIFILVGGFLLWRDRKLAARCTASTVGYDPYDPATAYLPEEKSEPFCRLFIIIGVVTFAIGAAAAIAWLFV